MHPSSSNRRFAGLIRITVASLLLLLQYSDAREADERSKFLYLHNPAAREVVWEYEPQMHAPHFVIEDRSDLHAKFAEDIAMQNQTLVVDIRPFFLREEYPIPRVVEYYSPWCGACQNFVSRYISVAAEVLNRLPPYHLEFYAVSCSEHHHLCLNEHVQHYPSTRVFPAYSSDYIELDSFSVETIDETLNLDLQHKSVSDADGKTIEHMSDVEEEKKESEEDDEDANMLDILGATNDVYRHTRTDVYRDAALSFTYALENHIYQEGQTSLDPEQATALAEWLDLLYWTLPPTWMVHALINDLRLNIDSIVQSKESLLGFVKLHQGVVHDNKKHHQWSQGCRNGEGVVASFSCGLWCLFHIVSVGVPERHAAVLGHRHRVSTQHALETTLNYIKFFFWWCPQCREQALQLHHSCAFNSCRRFRQRNKKSEKQPPMLSWQEFPIWLWQFHNDINEKLMAKEAYKLYGRRPHKAELERARWPPRDACLLCYRDNDMKHFNQHHLYEYLKEEYWPAGVQNFRFVVLDKKEQEGKPKAWYYVEYVEWFYDLLYLLAPRSEYELVSVGVAVVAMLSSYVLLSAGRKRLRMRKVRRTGRHKKYDTDALFEIDA